MGWRCDELSVWLLTVNYWSVLVVDWEIRRMSRCTLALLILAPLLLIDVIVCPPVTDKPLASTPAPAETDEDVVSISLPPSPLPLGNYIHSGLARGWKKRTAPDGSQEVRQKWGDKWALGTSWLLGATKIHNCSPDLSADNMHYATGYLIPSVYVLR